MSAKLDVFPVNIGDWVVIFQDGSNLDLYSEVEEAAHDTSKLAVDPFSDKWDSVVAS